MSTALTMARMSSNANTSESLPDQVRDDLQCKITLVTWESTNNNEAQRWEWWLGQGVLLTMHPLEVQENLWFLKKKIGKQPQEGKQTVWCCVCSCVCVFAIVFSIERWWPYEIGFDAQFWLWCMFSAKREKACISVPIDEVTLCTTPTAPTFFCLAWCCSMEFLEISWKNGVSLVQIATQSSNRRRKLTKKRLASSYTERSILLALIVGGKIAKVKFHW